MLEHELRRSILCRGRKMMMMTMMRMIRKRYSLEYVVARSVMCVVACQDESSR